MAALLYCFCAGTALADRKSCIVLEQRYEQIKSAAGSVERNSLLFSAAVQNCLPLTRLLLDAGASLEARDRLGNMPLAIAAKSGRVAIVAHFLDHSAPVNARNLEGSTALYLAAETGRLAIAKLLVEHKADPNIIGRSGISPLGAAAYEGNTELVSLLLSNGAEPRANDVTGKSAIVYAAGRAYTKVVEQLIEAGVDVNVRYGNDLTALMWAAGHSEEAGSADIVETLKLIVSRGARLDDADDRGRTALMIAAELGHRVATETLVAAGAATTLRDKTGKSAADLAPDEATRAILAAK